MKPLTFIPLLLTALGLIFFLTGCKGEQPAAPAKASIPASAPELSTLPNHERSVPPLHDFAADRAKAKAKP